MKQIYRYIGLLACTAALLQGTASCSDFLDRGSKTVFEDGNFWTSENNVKSYCWEFYNLFTGFGTGTNGDFYFTTFTDDQAARGMDLFPTTAPASNSHWDYTYIRKANLLLVRVPQMGGALSREAASHYLGVARFFRAFEYANLVRHFGDVPYIDKYLDQSDVEGMYIPRTPRTAVVDSIVADLQFAAANLRSISRSKTLGDANVVSAEVAWAFLARVALYEGTWAKYVEGDAARGEELLQIALEAAGKIVGNPDHIGVCVVGAELVHGFQGVVGIAALMGAGHDHIRVKPGDIGKALVKIGIVANEEAVAHPVNLQNGGGFRLEGVILIQAVEAHFHGHQMLLAVVACLIALAVKGQSHIPQAFRGLPGAAHEHHRVAALRCLRALLKQQPGERLPAFLQLCLCLHLGRHIGVFRQHDHIQAAVAALQRRQLPPEPILRINKIQTIGRLNHTNFHNFPLLCFIARREAPWQSVFSRYRFSFKSFS